MCPPAFQTRGNRIWWNIAGAHAGAPLRIPRWMNMLRQAQQPAYRSPHNKKGGLQAAPSSSNRALQGAAHSTRSTTATNDFSRLLFAHD